MQKRDFEVHGNLEIRYQKMLATQLQECALPDLHYDECLKKEKKCALSSFCTLPFLTYGAKNNTCRNFSEGYKAYTKYKENENLNCKDPCSQVEVKVQLDELMPIHQFMNPKESTASEPGYHFTIPTKIGVSEMVENYDLVSFVAEVGGWTGLFTGLSVFGILGVTLAQLASTTLTCLKKRENIIKSFIIILIMVCLGFVVQSSVSKLVRNPVGTDISLQSKFKDLSVSICKEKSLNNLKITNASEDDLANSLSIKDYLVDYIRTIELHYKDGSLESIFQNTWDEKGYKKSRAFQLYHLLTDENTIEFCFSFDVDGVKTVTIATNTELYFYIHYIGQRFYAPGKTRITALPYNMIDINKAKSKELIVSSSSALQLEYIHQTDSREINFDSCALSDSMHKFDMDINNEIIYDQYYLEKLRSIKEFKESCTHPSQFIRGRSSLVALLQKVQIHRNERNGSLISINMENRTLNLFLVLPDFVIFNKVILDKIFNHQE